MVSVLSSLLWVSKSIEFMIAYKILADSTTQLLPQAFKITYYLCCLLILKFDIYIQKFQGGDSMTKKTNVKSENLTWNLHPSGHPTVKVPKLRESSRQTQFAPSLHSVLLLLLLLLFSLFTYLCSYKHKEERAKPRMCRVVPGGTGVEALMVQSNRDIFPSAFPFVSLYWYSHSLLGTILYCAPLTDWLGFHTPMTLYRRVVTESWFSFNPFQNAKRSGVSL